MVAIVAGNSLGLFNSSINLIGAIGVSGHGTLRQTNAQTYVNAANGNLVLQSLDQMLSGRGQELAAFRTYNALGALDGPDSDGWRWDGEATLVLAGAYGQPGSSVTRTTGDGHADIFTWDDKVGAYTSEEGAGANEAITLHDDADPAKRFWLFTDPSTQVHEQYKPSAQPGVTARLMSRTDVSGNSVTFGYDDATGRLTDITDPASGQRIHLTYATVPNTNFTRLASLETFALAQDPNDNDRVLPGLGAPLTRVTYGYDTSGRLTSVTTDLTPDIATDNGDAGKLFTTVYGYDGPSFRIASITQSDGTHVEYTYDGQGRIHTASDANGLQTFTYDTDDVNGVRSTRVDVLAGRNADGTPILETWIYRYDIATQQLREIDSPPPAPGAAVLKTTFTYDPDTGNLASVTDGVGHTVTYTYDKANGNLLTQSDDAGDTVSRSYDDAGRLLTETHFRDFGPAPTEALTTRYVYDELGKVRFVVSADGRVTEYRYGTGLTDSGLVTQILRYAGGTFDASQYAQDSAPGVAAMVDWASRQDLKKIELTTVQYDLRGNVSRQTMFDVTDSQGNGVPDAGTTVTSYVYDAQGALLHVLARHGTDVLQTSMAYDGMGRLVGRTNAGGSQIVSYEDATGQIRVTSNAGVVSGTGLVTVSSYDGNGRLTSVSQSSDGTTRQTQYTYDARGRLVMVQDAAGGRSFTFYDDADRVVFQVDAAGGVTGFTYNGNGSVETQTRYATAASTADWTPDKTGLVPGTDFTLDAAHDQATAYTYDAAGRLETRTDAAGVVTTMRYDGLSRLVEEVSGNAILRYIYDGDGNLVGSVDEQGFLTEYTYDSADRLIQTTRYANASALYTNPNAPTDSLAPWRPSTDAHDQHTYNYLDGEGRVVGHVDARGFLTETVYDDEDNQRRDIEYKTAVAAGASDTLDSLRPFAAVDGIETVTTQFDDQERIAQTTGVDGTITTFEYDEAGRLVREVIAAGTNDERAMRTRYDGFDQVTGTLGGEGDAFLTSQAAQGGGQVIQGGLPGGDDSGPITEGGLPGDDPAPAGPTPDQIATAYDRYGTQYVYDALGNVVEVIAANGTGKPEDRHVSLTFRDADGRPIYTIDAARDVTRIDYDGAGQVRAQTQYGTPLDATLMGELASGAKGIADLKDALRGQPDDPPARVTSYDYDARGLLIQVTDPLGRITTNVYDDFGRIHTQTQVIAPGRTVTTQFDYDLKGELTTEIDDVGGLALAKHIGYDAFGRVVSVTDAAGNTTLTDYGRDAGRTVDVTDALGRTMHAEYDFAGRVLTLTDAVNMALPAAQRKSTTYAYDDVQRKTTVTTPEGVVVVTAMTALGQTSSVTDGRGNTTHYEYNRDGELLRATDALHDADHPLVVNHYQTNGLLDYSIDANGVYTTYTYDALNRVLERRVDPKTLPTGAANPGGLDEACAYAFDAFGEQTAVTCGTGDLTNPANVASVTTYDYYADGRLKTTTVDPAGLALTTEYTYDGLGDMLTVAQGTAADPNQRVTQYFYDNLGRRTEQVDALGNTTRYKYDANSRLTRTIDALGNSTWYVYDAAGQVVDTVDALGGVTQNAYDRDGRLTQVRRAATRLDAATLAGFGDVVTLATPDLGDQTPPIIVDHPGGGDVDNIPVDTSVLTPPDIQPGDAREIFVYDDDGNQRFALQSVDGTKWTITENRFDGDRNIVETRRYDKFMDGTSIDGHGAARAPQITIASIKAVLTSLGYSDTNPASLALVQRTHYAYDADDQLRFTVDTLGSVKESVYDLAGNVVETVDYAVRPTLTAYDEATIDHAVNRSDPDNRVTHVAYDAAGRALFIVDGRGAVIGLSYDALGRLVTSVKYAAIPVLAAFDAASIAKAVNGSDPENQTTRYVLDAAGRVRFTLTAQNGTSWTISENRFDALDQVVETRVYDQMPDESTLDALDTPDSPGISESEIASLLSSMGYDDTKPATLAHVQITHIAFDAVGNVRFVVDAVGNITESQYDAMQDVVASIVYAAPPVLTAFDEAGIAAAVDRTNPDNRVDHYAYDALRELRFSVHVMASDATGRATQQQMIEKRYDSLGRDVQDISYVSTIGTVRDYDTATLATIAGANGSVSDVRTATVYDAAGNALYSLRASRIDPLTLQSTQFIVTANHVDALGRVTDTTAYAGQLGSLADFSKETVDVAVAAIAADAGNRTTHFAYDTAGDLRMAQDAQGGRTFSIYDAFGQLRYRVDPAGAVTGFTYDADGDVRTLTQYANPVAVVADRSNVDDLVLDPDNDRLTTFDYDAEDRLTTATDAHGIQTITKYDRESRVISQRIGNQTTQFFYDSQGNQVGVLDAMGFLTEKTYNLVGQLTGTIRYSNPSPAAVDSAAPVWIGVTDQDAVGGKPFSYAMHAMDADGDTVTYSLTGTVPAWLTLDRSIPTAPTLRGTPPKGQASYTVTVRADDGRGNTTDTTVTITVVNTAPSWQVLEDDSVAANSDFELFLPEADDNESDSEGLTYAITSDLPHGLIFDELHRSITGTPDQPGTYTITATVTDDGTPPLTTTRSFVIQVTNNGPAFTTAVPPQQAQRTKPITIAIPPAVDPESQALTYRLFSGPSWLTLDPVHLTLSGTPPAGLTLKHVTAVVEAEDTFGETVRLSISIAVDNAPPEWQALPPGPPQSYRHVDVLPLPALDPDGGPVTYSATGGLPGGLTVDKDTGRIHGQSNITGTFHVMLRATDQDGGFVERMQTITLTNKAPDWTPGPFPSQSYTQAIDFFPSLASDVDGGKLTYTIVGISPPNILGLVMDPDTGRLQGSGPPGNYQVTLRVQDELGFTTDRTVSIGLTNQAPIVIGTYPAPPPMHTGNGFLAHWSRDTSVFAELDGDSLTLSIDTPLPPGLHVLGTSTATQINFEYNGSAITSGNFPMTIRATDSFGAFATITFNIHIDIGIDHGFVGGGDSESPLITVSEPASAPQAPAVAPPTAAPVSDVLAGLRPQSGAKDLRTHQYYDRQGRLVGSVDERGFLTETVYDTQHNQSRVITYMKSVSVGDADTLDDVRRNALAGGGKTQTSITTYDNLGRIKQVTGVDGTTVDYEYDAAGRLVHQVVAAGTEDESGTRIRYDAFDEVTGRMGGEGDHTLNGSPTQAQVDSAIALYGTQFQYDRLGNVIKTIDPAPSAATASQQSFFDADGRLVYQAIPSPDLAEHDTLTFRDANGRPVYTVNAAGEVTRAEYNTEGQVTRQTRFGNRLDAALLADLDSGTKGVADLAAALAAMPADENQVVTYDYNQLGQLARMTDALGFITSNTYDIFGNLATQTRTIDIASGKTVTTEFDYDLRNELVSQTSDVGGLNFNVQRTYDAFGRLHTSTDAAGNVTTTEYGDDNSGRIIEVTDPLGRTTHTEFDALDRVITITDPINQVLPDGEQKSTKYVYDDVNRTVTLVTPEGISVVTTRTRRGQTLTVKDGRGKTTTYSYDKNGELLTVTDALKNVVLTNNYDKNGLLLSSVDANGIVTQYTYDAVNRLVLRITDPFTVKPGQTDPTGLALACSYQFDAFGQGIATICGVSGDGKNVVNVTSTTTTRFDLDGRVTRLVTDPLGLKLATTYTLDGLGNVLTVAQGTVDEPDQQVTQYVFDALGRRTKTIEAPSSVFGLGSANARDLTTSYAYDTQGNVSSVTDANGNKTWFVHDAAGELVQTIDPLGGVIENTFDRDGRVIQTQRFATPVPVDGFGDAVATPVAPSRTPDDQRTFFVFNNDNQLRYRVQAQHDGEWSVVETRYDENGNVVDVIAYDQPLHESDIAADDTPDSPGLSEAEVAKLLDDAYTGIPDRFALTQRTRYAYDDDNQLRFVIDALGSVTEMQYDKRGDVVTTSRFAQRPTLAAFDEATINGAVDRNDAANQITHYAYNAARQLRFTVRVLASDGAGHATQQVITEQRRDSLGRAVLTVAYATVYVQSEPDFPPLASFDERTLEKRAALIAGPNDRIRACTYDAAGREIYVALALTTTTGGQTETRYVVTRQDFDAMGHVVESTAYATAIPLPPAFRKPYMDAAVLAIANPAVDRSTHFLYDRAGRQSFIVAPDRSVTEMVRDALGQVTELRQLAIDVPADIPLTEAALVGLRAGRHVGDGVTRGSINTYDANGHLLSTTDGEGFTEFRDYNALGQMVAFAGKNDFHGEPSAEWTYTYDRVGRLVDSISPGVPTNFSDGFFTYTNLDTRNEYDTFGNLTRVFEATGTVDQRETNYRYDRLGRVTTVTLPGVYDAATGLVLNLENVDDPGTAMARTIDTGYDALGNVVTIATRTAPQTFQLEYRAYDNFGRLKADVDAMGEVKTYDYDVFGDQIATTQYSKTVGTPPDGLFGHWTVDTLAAALGTDPDARVIHVAFDNMGRARFSVDPSGTVSESAYDVFGDMTLFARYAKRPDLGTAFDEATIDGKVDRTNPGNQVNHIAYNAVGEAVFTVDATGGVTESDYDAFREIVTTTAYKIAPTLAGYDVATISAAVDRDHPDNQMIRYVYDARGFRRFVLTADFNQTWDITEQRGDGVGNVVEVRRYDQFLGEDRVDAMALASPLGSITPDQVRSELATLGYDDANPDSEKLIQSTRFVYDRLNRVAYTIDGLGDVTLQDYDEFGAVVRTTRFARTIDVPPGDEPTTFEVNDLLSDDAADEITHYTRDVAGNVAFVTRDVTRDENADPVDRATTRYRYDSMGRVTETIDYATTFNRIDANNYNLIRLLIVEDVLPSVDDHRTSFVYDLVGRQLYTLRALRIDPDTLQTTQSVVTGNVYNAFSEIMSSTAYAGILGPLADESRATVDDAVKQQLAGNADNRTTRYAYDIRGEQRFVVKADGSLAEMVYNELGQVTETRQFEGGDGGVSVPAGTPITESALAGLRGDRHVGDTHTRGEKYTYDPAGRLHTIQDAGGFTETNGYDALGNRTSRIDKNGNTWTYEFDRQGRQIIEHSPPVLVQLSSQRSPTLQSVATRVYFNALGQIFRKDEAAGTPDVRQTFYGYDRAGRQNLVQLPGYYDPSTGTVVSNLGPQPPGSFVRQTKTDFDAFGNVRRMGIATGLDASGNLVYQYEYTAYDNLNRVTDTVDAVGDVSHFDYDVFGDQTIFTRFSKPVDPRTDNGLWTTDTLSAAIGDDADKRVINMKYDILGRRIETKQPQATTYDASASESAAAPTDVSTLTVDDSGITIFEYNVFNEIKHEAEKIDNLDGGHFRDTWHQYDVMGNETGTSVNGFVTLRKFDAFGNLTQTAELAARQTFSRQNPFPLRAPITLPQDRITDYKYNALNQQTDVLRENVIYYNPNQDDHVDNNSGATAIEFLHTTYDGLGNVLTQTDALDNTTTRHYNARGQVDRDIGAARAVVADPSSGNFFNNFAIESPITAYTLNAFGQVVRSDLLPFDGAAPIRITLQIYDAGGNLTGSVDANSAGTYLADKDAGESPAPTIQFAYDYAGRLIRQSQHVVSVLGERFINGQLTPWRTVDYTLDKRYVYDGIGRQIAVLDVFVDTDSGRLSQSGQRTLFNAFGEVNAKQLVWADAGTPLDGMNHATLVTYHYNHAGNLDIQEDATGTTRYLYNVAGLTTRQEQQGNGSSADGTSTRITEYCYDFFGRLTLQRQPSFKAVVAGASPGGFDDTVLTTPVTVQTNDRWGNVLTSTTEGAVGGAGYERLTTTYTYNQDNKVISVRQPAVRVTRPDGSSYLANVHHDSHFDLLGRDLEETDVVDDDPTTAAFEARVMRVHRNTYDTAGELTSEAVGLADDPFGFNSVTSSYAYDIAGNRIATLDPVGQVFTDTYDLNGNQLNHGIQKGSRTVILQQYGYDTANRRIEVDDYVDDTRTRFNATFTHYDERSFVRGTFEMRVDFNPSILDLGHEMMTAAYDIVGNKTAQTDQGRNTQTWDYDTDLQDTVDAHGNPVFAFTKLRVLGTDSKDTSGNDVHTGYEYNDFGQVDRENYSNDDDKVPLEGSRTYGFYENGLLASVTDESTVGTIRPEPNSNDFISSSDASFYEYNLRGQITREIFAANTASGDHRSQYQDDFITFFPHNGVPGDPTGLHSLRNLPALFRITNTTYDDLGRVTSVSSASLPERSSLPSLTYDYDELGNRWRISTTSDQVLASKDGDGSGDFEGETAKVELFAFDTEGRMTVADGAIENGQVVAGDSGTRIFYDGAGRREFTVTNEGPQRKDVEQVVLYGSSEGIDLTYTIDYYATWTQTHTERYTYDDLGHLTEIDQSDTQSNRETGAFYKVAPPGDLNPPPPPLPATDHPGANTTGFVTLDKRSYNLLGQLIEDDQFDRLHFGDGLTDDTTSSIAHADQVSTTTDTYDNHGFLATQTVHKFLHPVSASSVVTYTYDADTGVLSKYRWVQGKGDAETLDDIVQFDNTYTYHYTFIAGSQREKSISLQSNLQDPIPFHPSVTTNYYDAHGNLVRETADDMRPDPNFRDSDGRPQLNIFRTQYFFTYNALGLAMTKDVNEEFPIHDETVGTPFIANEDYFYAGARDAVGTIGSGTLRDSTQFQNDFTPVSPTYPGTQPSAYTVQNGDTLQSIAKAVLGDAALWYLIADANNIKAGPSEALGQGDVGRTLRIPNVIANIHNNASTFAPYNPANITGNNLPQAFLPPPPLSECQRAAQQVSMFVSFLVTAVLGIALAEMGPAGEIIAATAGNAAGQFTYLEMHGDSLEKFSGTALAETAFTAAATAGLAAGASAALGGGESSLLGTGLLGKVVGGAVGGAASALASAAINSDKPNQDPWWEQGVEGAFGGAVTGLAGKTAGNVAQFGLTHAIDGKPVSYAEMAGLLLKPLANTVWYGNPDGRQPTPAPKPFVLDDDWYKSHVGGWSPDDVTPDTGQKHFGDNIVADNRGVDLWNVSKYLSPGGGGGYRDDGERSDATAPPAGSDGDQGDDREKAEASARTNWGVPRQFGSKWLISDDSGNVREFETAAEAQAASGMRIVDNLPERGADSNPNQRPISVGPDTGESANAVEALDRARGDPVKSADNSGVPEAVIDSEKTKHVASEAPEDGIPTTHEGDETPGRTPAELLEALLRRSQSLGGGVPEPYVDYGDHANSPPPPPPAPIRPPPPEITRSGFNLRAPEYTGIRRQIVNEQLSPGLPPNSDNIDTPPMGVPTETSEAVTPPQGVPRTGGGGGGSGGAGGGGTGSGSGGSPGGGGLETTRRDWDEFERQLANETPPRDVTITRKGPPIGEPPPPPPEGAPPPGGGTGSTDDVYSRLTESLKKYPGRKPSTPVGDYDFLKLASKGKIPYDSSHRFPDGDKSTLAEKTLPEKERRILDEADRLAAEAKKGNGRGGGGSSGGESGAPPSLGGKKGGDPPRIIPPPPNPAAKPNDSMRGVKAHWGGDGPAIHAHGREIPNDFFRVPKGTRLVYLVPSNVALGQDAAISFGAGRVHEEFRESGTTVESNEFAPELNLRPLGPNDVVLVGNNVHTVNRTTRLSNMIGENMGTVYVVACRTQEGMPLDARYYTNTTHGTVRTDPVEGWSKYVSRYANYLRPGEDPPLIPLPKEVNAPDPKWVGDPHYGHEQFSVKFEGADGITSGYINGPEAPLPPVDPHAGGGVEPSLHLSEAPLTGGRSTFRTIGSAGLTAYNHANMYGLAYNTVNQVVQGDWKGLGISGGMLAGSVVANRLLPPGPAFVITTAAGAILDYRLNKSLYDQEGFAVGNAYKGGLLGSALTYLTPAGILDHFLFDDERVIQGGVIDSGYTTGRVLWHQATGFVDSFKALFDLHDYRLDPNPVGKGDFEPVSYFKRDQFGA